MTGKEVKEKLKSEGVSLAELAKLLGYDNDQRLHSALKALDVKSGLLEDIAKATNKNVCWFYGDVSGAIATEHSYAVSGNGNQINSISEKYIALLQKKDEQIDRLLSVIEQSKK